MIEIWYSQKIIDMPYDKWYRPIRISFYQFYLWCFDRQWLYQEYGIQFRLKDLSISFKNPFKNLFRFLRKEGDSIS